MMKFNGGPHHGELFKRSRRKITIRTLLSNLREGIEKEGLKNISLIGAGLSGAAIVPTLADKLKLPFALVRTPGSRTVVGPVFLPPDKGGDRRIIGEFDKNIIFCDDLVDRGRTTRLVNKRLKQLGYPCIRARVVAGYPRWTNY